MIELEKYNLMRSNYWTGLRIPYDKQGYNWTLLFCLLYKTNNKVPLDGIIYIINEFLNWLPSCVWNMSHYPLCNICLSPYWRGDDINVPSICCSFQCLEKERYNILLLDYYEYIEIIDLFYIDPSYAVYKLARYIEAYDYNYENIEFYLLKESISYLNQYVEYDYDE